MKKIEEYKLDGAGYFVLCLFFVSIFSFSFLFVKPLFADATLAADAFITANGLGTLTSVNFNLPLTTAITGIVNVNAVPFFHSYGTENLWIGKNAGNFITTGGGVNVGIGTRALVNVTTGQENVALGFQSLEWLSTGSANMAIGSQALHGVTTERENTAIGRAAGYGVTSRGNIAIGYNTAYNGFGNGQYNTAIGTAAMSVSNSGNNNENVFIGSFSGTLLAGSSFNTGIGTAALFSITTGSNNTAVGYYAGNASISSKALSTGSNNTFIGYKSGITASSTQPSNSTAIGYLSEVNASNVIVLGAIGSNSVNVGIGTSSPTSRLSIVGNAGSVSPLFDVSTSTLVSYFRINSNGNVGIGTTSASSTLAVNGSLLLIGTSTIATSSAGTIYFNSADKHFYGFNGTEWSQLENGSSTVSYGDYLIFNTMILLLLAVFVCISVLQYMTLKKKQ
ncbi:MAG: hypothetical protein V4664_01255 [Patescibacteria group bacterium]